MQRTGQLYGSGNKAATVCHRGGRGRGAAGRAVNPARSPGLWQGQASQEPTTLYPRHSGESFFPQEDGVCLRMGKGRLLHSATARPLPPPPSQGHALGRGSAPPFDYKHLLSADFMPEFSNPQGAATKALPTCKITTGSSGPQEANGQDPNSFWQSHIEGWRLTPAGESVSLLQSCHGAEPPSPFPTYHGWEGKKGGDIFLLIGHIFHFTLVTDSLWPLQCTSSHLRGCPSLQHLWRHPPGPGG